MRHSDAISNMGHIQEKNLTLTHTKTKNPNFQSNSFSAQCCVSFDSIQQPYSYIDPYLRDQHHHALTWFIGDECVPKRQTNTDKPKSEYIVLSEVQQKQEEVGINPMDNNKNNIVCS